MAIRPLCMTTRSCREIFSSMTASDEHMLLCYLKAIYLNIPNDLTPQGHQLEFLVQGAHSDSLIFDSIVHKPGPTGKYPLSVFRPFAEEIFKQPLA